MLKSQHCKHFGRRADHFPTHHFFTRSDDEIEVGADLYEIDTEAEATVEGAEVPHAAKSIAPDSSPPPESTTPLEAVVSDAPSREPSSRIPSIKFLGKEGWQRALAPEPELLIPATYGRLDFSEEEIEALLTGGANIAPDVEEYSEGAVFSA